MKTTRIMNKIIIYLSAVLLLCKTLCSVSILNSATLLQI